MTDFFSINRYALITRPSSELIKWVNTVFPDDPVAYAEIEGEQHDQMDVFLIPEFDDVEGALGWVRENCATFLEQILDSWCTDEDTWPESLDWALFERFVDYSIQSVVTDTVDEEEDEDNDGEEEE